MGREDREVVEQKQRILGRECQEGERRSGEEEIGGRQAKKIMKGALGGEGRSGGENERNRRMRAREAHLRALLFFRSK